MQPVMTETALSTHAPAARQFSGISLKPAGRKTGGGRRSHRILTVTAAFLRYPAVGMAVDDPGEHVDEMAARAGRSARPGFSSIADAVAMRWGNIGMDLAAVDSFEVRPFS
jgi:hypothetical protein